MATTYTTDRNSSTHSGRSDSMGLEYDGLVDDLSEEFGERDYFEPHEYEEREFDPVFPKIFHDDPRYDYPQ